MALNTKTISAGVGDILNIDGGVDASSPRQVLDGDGTGLPLYLTTTKLGVGESSPDCTLHIKGSGTDSLAILESTDNNAELEILSSTAGSAETHNSSLIFGSGGASKGTIYYDHHATPASQKFIIKVGDDATSAMTILGNGRVGIGTTSPAGMLELEDDTTNTPSLYITNISPSADDLGGNLIFRLSDPGTNLTTGDVLGDISFTGRDNSDDTYIEGARIRAKTNGTPGTDDMPTQLQFFTNSGSDSSTQRMCILANGKVGINEDAPDDMLHIKESTSGQYVMKVEHTHSSEANGINISYSGGNGFGSGDDYPIYFQDTDGAHFTVSGDGSATITGSGTAVSSDRRIKTDIVDATSKLNDINSLKVRNFDYIHKDGTKSGKKHIGFIADEFATVFPSMVTTVKQKAFGEDYTDLQRIMDSALVPILVKAIQELSAKVTALESA